MITLTGPTAANAMGLKVGRVLQAFPPVVEIDEKSDDYALVKLRVKEANQKAAASKRQQRLDRAEQLRQQEKERRMAAPNGVHPAEDRLVGLERSLKNLEALLQQASVTREETTPVVEPRPSPEIAEEAPQEWEPKNRRDVPHYLDKYIGSLILCRDRHKDAKGSRRDRIAWVEYRDGDYLYGGQTGGKRTIFKVSGRTISNNTNYFVLMWSWQNQIHWPQE